MSNGGGHTEASDFEKELVAAVNDAAGYCRTLWAAFITYMGAVFILVSGTTHEDLLRETPVKMPLFELGVPLRLFYVIAPLLLVLFHLNLLLKLHDLRLRVRALADARTGPDERALLRRRLLAFDYGLLTGNLVGDRRERSLLTVVSNATIFIMPIVLLLYVQLQFLPYHGSTVTWTHRALVFVDLSMIFLIQRWMETPASRTMKSLRQHLVSFLNYIWQAARDLWTLVRRQIARGEDAHQAPTMAEMMRSLREFSESIIAWIRKYQPETIWGRLLNPLVLIPILWRLMLATGVIAISIFFLAYPSEEVDIFWSRQQPGARPPVAGSDYAERFGIARSLYLPGRTFWSKNPPVEILAVYEAKHLSDPAAEKSASPLARQREAQDRYAEPMDIRGRDLSFADFEQSSFRKARMSGNFRGASFRSADLQGTDFNDSHIEDAKFAAAQLQHANLSGVHAANADFETANLEHAIMTYADFSGADFENASMYGAALAASGLQGADLEKVDARKADFSHAWMTAARLTEGNFQDADFSYAKMAAAYFAWAKLQNAVLQSAQLRGAFFPETYLAGTFFKGADVSLANFADADFQALIQAQDMKIPPDYDPNTGSTVSPGGSGGDSDILASGLSEASGDAVFMSQQDLGLAGPHINRVPLDRYSQLMIENLVRVPCRDVDDASPATRRAIATSLIAIFFGDSWLRTGEPAFEPMEAPRYARVARAMLSNTKGNCILPYISDEAVRNLTDFAARTAPPKPRKARNQPQAL